MTTQLSQYKLLFYFLLPMLLASTLFVVSNTTLRQTSITCYYVPGGDFSDPLYDPLPTGNRNFDTVEARGFPFIYQHEGVGECTDEPGAKKFSTSLFAANLGLFLGVGIFIGVLGLGLTKKNDNSNKP